MSQIHNEQIKLAANLLNTLAAAGITIGVITPGVALMLGTSAAPSPGTALLGMIVWLSVGLGLHWLARLTLARLRRDPD